MGQVSNPSGDGHAPQPLITIATVVLNAADVLERAIESVRQHRCEGVEYIVIDGGSTDGTVDLIKRRTEVVDRWISEPDGGIYDAMNKALRLASGRWILFLGADDEMLAPLSDVMSRFVDDDAVYYGDVEFAISGDRYGGAFSTGRLLRKNICHQALFYPRSIYLRKRYDCDAGVLADYKYNLELWGGHSRFAYLPVIVSRFNETGASSSNTAYFAPLKQRIIRDNFGFAWYAAWRLVTALGALRRAGRIWFRRRHALPFR